MHEVVQGESPHAKQDKEKAFKEHARSASHSALAWAGVGLTSFVLMVTLFTRYPPTAPHFESYFDAVGALVLGSCVFSVLAWFLADSAGYPQPMVWKSRRLRTKSVLYTSDVLLSIGCFMVGSGFGILVFSLEMWATFTVYTPLFVVSFAIAAFLRFAVMK